MGVERHLLETSTECGEKAFVQKNKINEETSIAGSCL